jgi:mercuric ion transport protein
VDDRKLLRVGIVGAAIAALCCFTPVLAVLLGVLGLSAWAAGLEDALLAALLIFVALIVYALLRRSRAAAERAKAR